jgi:hypothetical protein
MYFTTSAFTFWGILGLLADESTLLVLTSQVGTETVALFSLCDSTLSSFSLFPSISHSLYVAIRKMEIIIIAVITRRN